MEELEEQINSYFKDEEIPQLSKQEINRLENKVAENKKNHSHISFIRLCSLIACMLIILITPAIVLPLTLKPHLRYYGDYELERVELEQSYIEDVISSEFSKYNFIFDDCDMQSMYGYFTPDKNKKLLALDISFIKNSIPYTKCDFCLVIENNFKYSHHGEYIKNSEVIIKDEYTLYKKVVENILDTDIIALFEYDNYSLYLTLNRKDNNFFEKFC